MRKVYLWIVVVALALALAPSASALAAPDARYFPATGHWVQGDFLSFFDQHGGLATFGYPRTEQMVTDGRVVQYFQRARMESWPSNPPPYNVQLMLIGDAVMGPGDPPIPASQIPAASDATKTYFPQTGHTLSGAFRDYFNAHGGLMIFGYPTSEPSAGPSGFLIQRFQRTRMEYHPELPVAYQVSLGLLGDEYIFGMNMVSPSATRPVSGDQVPTLANLGDGQLVFQTRPGGDLIVSGLNESNSHVVGQGMDPAWSPDGSKIAYAKWGENAGIYVMNADGSGAHQVYADPEDRAPVWSPDGSQIAFFRRYDGNVMKPDNSSKEDFFQVVVLDLKTGTSWLPANQTEHCYSPSWSPDGQTLVMNCDGGLYLATRNQPITQIPNTDYLFTTPTWSPDGKQIAFTYRSSDHWDIGVIDPDGTGFAMLTNGAMMAAASVNNASAAWSPDGQHLIFVSDRSGSWNLYIMSRDGSSVVPAGTTALTYTDSDDRVVSWKKDGS
ncbi:MAG: hypothetical protein ACRDIY_10640 [Chloroflexota bacterium]